VILSLLEATMDLPAVDIAASVVDWVIDYPDCVAVFEEFSIDYSWAGKSLEYACSEANANLAVVCSKLRIILHTTTKPPNILDREE